MSGMARRWSLAKSRGHPGLGWLDASCPRGGSVKASERLVPGEREKEGPMDTRYPKLSPSLPRRDLLRAGLAAGTVLSARHVLIPGRASAQPRRGGILRVRGYDPPHFDPHLTLNFKTNTTLSFVYNRLVRYKVGPGVA